LQQEAKLLTRILQKASEIPTGIPCVFCFIYVTGVARCCSRQRRPCWRKIFFAAPRTGI